MDQGQFVATLIGTIGFLAGTVGTLAKLYRDSLKEQLTNCQAENQTLRAESRETNLALAREKDEWKQLVLERKGNP